MRRLGWRYAMVASALGCACVVLACAALVRSSAGGRAVEALQEMLCCDGCCAASASIAGAIVSSDAASSRASQRGRPTILHMAGSSEIDYTAGGHRVSQHMESALSELDNLEDHVKDGRPKFLTESAAQREADLMSDKFAHQDLAGKQVRKKAMVDPYAKAEEAQLEKKGRKPAGRATHRKDAPQNQSPSKFSATSNERAERTEQVAEATRLSMAVKRQQTKDSKSFNAPLHIISKDLHSAESDAARAIKNIAHTKVVSTGPPLPSLDDPAKASAETSRTSSSIRPKPQSHGASLAGSGSGFQPITTSGWNHVLRARSDAASTVPSDSADAKDEDILRKLAQSDIDYAKSVQGRQASVSNGAVGLKPVDGAAAGIAGGDETHKLKLPMGSADRADRQPGESPTPARNGQDVKSATGAKKGEKGLNGVLNHINHLIASQTGGASKHPSYFKHFDSAQAKAAAAKLAAVHAQAQSILAAHSSTAHARQGSQLKEVVGRRKAGGVRARGGEAGGGGVRERAAGAELQPAAAVGDAVTGSGAHGDSARLSVSAKQPRGGSHGAALRGGADKLKVSKTTVELRDMRSGMGSEDHGGVRERQPDGRLAGSGVALKEEAMLYGSHHDLDRHGAKALKDSSLIGLGL